MVYVDKEYVFGPSCSKAIPQMTPALFEGLRNRETTFVLPSLAPYEKIAAAKAERGWDVPWYSSYTYSTYARGMEYTTSSFTYIDYTALGRQESWEKPEGRADVLHLANGSLSGRHSDQQ
jgi:predicted dithiol-disulfide oxidoreductase (DUF899 family)